MRKILIMFLICISPSAFITGCQANTEMSEKEIREMGNIPFDKNYGFTKIKEISAPDAHILQSLYLVSDNQTRIIYYYSPSVYQKSRNICPYYSENGKLCKFIDNEIVEIE